MFDKMKDLMEMKRQAERIKRELDSSLVEVNEVSGIRIAINGSQTFKSLEIDDALVQPGSKKQLEANLLRGVNEAIKKSQTLAAQKMRAVMPSLPGM